ncbi:hypothetical protein HNP84_006072 [Thermocatellispora tengchongensis]|uniref:Uncharacterized protein n=1 Tax=Thermocatellispora tengchongensis TaxID=1073253 RepID=A0A840PJU2_9ACTN|nr:hypothetical protein [Thermocatellispora tengchongensis]MBB5136325.1 hypothetical protein [Thermocatellispora tengchongensis]
MDSAAEVLGVLIGVSTGLFIVIAAAVALPGRAREPRGAPGPRDDVVWFGGPGHGEHGVGDSTLVLVDGRPGWVSVPEIDWPALAETAEPGPGVGGASAGW